MDRVVSYTEPKAREDVIDLLAQIELRGASSDVRDSLLAEQELANLYQWALDTEGSPDYSLLDATTLQDVDKVASEVFTEYHAAFIGIPTRDTDIVMATYGARVSAIIQKHCECRLSSTPRPTHRQEDILKGMAARAHVLLTVPRPIADNFTYMHVPLPTKFTLTSIQGHLHILAPALTEVSNLTCNNDIMCPLERIRPKGSCSPLERIRPVGSGQLAIGTDPS